MSTTIDSAIIKTLVEHIGTKSELNLSSMRTGLMSMLESRLKDIPHEWSVVEKDGIPYATLTFTSDKKIVPEVGDIFIVGSSAYRFSFYFIVIDVEDAGERIRYKTYGGTQFDADGIYMSKDDNSSFDLGHNTKAPDDVKTGWFRPKAEFMQGLNPYLFYHIIMFNGEIDTIYGMR